MFLAEPLSRVTGLDAVLFVAIMLGVVADAVFSRRRMKALDAGTEPGLRLAIYRESLLFQWGATFVIAAVWAANGRPFPELGLGLPSTLGFAVGAGLTLVACAALALQVVVVRMSAKARADLARQVATLGPGVARVLPRTQAERLTFVLVAATAGIAEEIIFRGYLMWGLAHWAPVWAAALLSTALFTFGHLYQESWSALARVALTGAIFAALTIVSGSLLPAIVLHFAVDLASVEFGLGRAERDRSAAGVKRLGVFGLYAFGTLRELRSGRAVDR